MSEVNNAKNISNTSTRGIESKCLNLSSLGKKETYMGTCKTDIKFDTDKSLINLPRQMITKSNDLNIVNTYSSILDSSAVNENNSSRTSKKKTETEEEYYDNMKQNFTERTIYDEMNQAERNMEGME
jgi:hypothetical protein